MQKKIDISVIMATYNTKSEYLTSAIESILKQSFENFELIIVNDGGNDIATIKTYHDNRIIIINHKEKMGLPKSLNDAIKISKGKYIARMDSDDISLPERLQLQYDYMEQHRDIDICSTYARTFGGKEEVIADIHTTPAEIKCELFFRSCLIHPTVMIKKSFLKKYNLLYNEEFSCAQDFELWTRCSKVGNISIIPIICLNYRVHSEQASISKHELQESYRNKVILKNLEELNLKSEFINIICQINGNEGLKDLDKISEFIEEAIDKNLKKKIYK